MLYDAFAMGFAFLWALWLRFDNFNSIPQYYLNRNIKFMPFYIRYIRIIQNLKQILRFCVIGNSSFIRYNSPVTNHKTSGG